MTKIQRAVFTFHFEEGHKSDAEINAFLQENEHCRIVQLSHGGFHRNKEDKLIETVMILVEF